MRPIFLQGTNIFLGALSPAGKLEGYEQWVNDQETTLFMGTGRFPSNRKDLLYYIRAYSSSKDGMILGIFTNKTRQHVGNITLHLIDWRNRNAEIGVIIGDKTARGKGYATDAIRLVADHAFNKLNLHKITAGMISGNNASKRAFDKVGFKVEGILREHFFLNGKYLDCYRLGLLKRDFTL